jgi:GNAT superfamily N-acetyltransferase
MSKGFVRIIEERGYVATIGDTVVGTGMIDLESGQIDMIFVQPSHMGRRIGVEIMSYLESLAAAAGLAQMQLDATLNAVSFYRACGFVGDVVAKYESPRGISLDCIPMVKDLYAA